LVIWYVKIEAFCQFFALKKIYFLILEKKEAIFCLLRLILHIKMSFSFI